MKRTLLLLTLCISSSIAAQCCSDDWDIYGDWIYFESSGDSLDLLSVSTGTTNSPTNPRIRNEKWQTIEICPGFDSGYRVGISKNLIYAKFIGEWTFFSSEETTNYNFSGPSSDTNTFKTSSDFFGAENSNLVSYDVNSEYLFEFQRLDIGFEKSIYNCNSIIFTPFTTFTYLQTKQNLTGNNNLVFVSPLDTTSIRKFSESTKYDGFGATVGCGLLWNFLDTLGISAKTSVSYLYGKNNVNWNFNRVENQFVGSDDSFAFDYCKSKGRLVSYLQLGLITDAIICDGFNASGMVGWEHHTFFDQTDWKVHENMAFGTEFKNSANLYLQGLVVRLGMAY